MDDGLDAPAPWPAFEMRHARIEMDHKARTARHVGPLRHHDEAAGRSRQGLAVLDQALAAARGKLAGQVLTRRARALWELGRFHEARRDLSRALPYFRRAADTLWEARSLTARAFVFLGLGLPARAATDFARAEELMKQALAIREKVLGPEHPDVAVSLSNLASLYDEMGEPDRAETHRAARRESGADPEVDPSRRQPV